MGPEIADWAMVVLLGPVLAVAVAGWVYRDARRRGHDAWGPWAALAIGGLFLTGSVPGLVALAIAGEAAVQGFPTCSASSRGWLPWPPTSRSAEPSANAFSARACEPITWPGPRGPPS